MPSQCARRQSRETTGSHKIIIHWGYLNESQQIREAESQATACKQVETRLLSLDLYEIKELTGFLCYSDLNLKLEVTHLFVCLDRNSSEKQSQAYKRSSGRGAN